MTKKHSITSEYLDSINGFLIGSKLGDGAFIQRTPNHNTYITFKHAENQYEYLLWKKEYLKEISLKSVKERKFTEGKKDEWQRQFYFSTISLKELNIYRKYSVYELLDQLSEIAFVVWLLDDGNLYKNCWKLSCGRFNSDELKYTTKIIKDKFNINSYTYEHPTKRNKGYIRFSPDDVNKINELILNNVPNNIDIIKHKILSY